MNTFLAHESHLPPQLSQPIHATTQAFESLPFTVRLVSTVACLDKAVELRHSAYARHLPRFAEALMQPETCDFKPDSAVLIAESKLDGSALGTMRIQTNHCGTLDIEKSFNLQNHLGHQCFAELTRLATATGRDSRLVKVALFKAMYLYCFARQVDFMVVCARKPLDRQYVDLAFKDVETSEGFYPMSHIGDIPHRVLCMRVQTAERHWFELAHPLYRFMFESRHPDIKVVEQFNLNARGAAISIPQPIAAQATPEWASK